MRISSMKLKEPIKGLSSFSISSLGDMVILAGSNGSGKTRLLKLLNEHICGLAAGKGVEGFQLYGCWQGEEKAISKENISEIELVNYSHFDARLQSPRGFTTYVICKAKELLKTCSYEETALNAILLLEDMAHGYSEIFQDGTEFERFVKDYAIPFHIDISKDRENNLKIFGKDMESANLSPGQLYLLRIAVACYCNSNSPNLVFLLDEPEQHLHPQAQIELIKTLRSKFSEAQFWIATHSLALISYLTVTEKCTTTLHLKTGKVNIFRSNSESLLEGLIGSEENLFAVRQLLAAPDEYACNKFAAECTNPPNTERAKGNDPQTELVETMFRENDVIVDYGAGKGRFLEELALSSKRNIADKIQYFAYDPDDKDKKECENTMARYHKMRDNYFNDGDLLLKRVESAADYVLLVNVLHEINPCEWQNVFRVICNLLKPEGHLIIVEREELTVGEAPYDKGFLMLTQDGATELFGEERYTYDRHPKKPYIIKYVVEKAGLTMEKDAVQRCIEKIKEGAFQKISELKRDSSKDSDLGRFRKGIRLAFYLHQYANAALINDDLKNSVMG